MVIGRSADADIMLDDDGVSREHAVVEVRDGKPWLLDLNSTNGTWLEGERVAARQMPLNDGDRIRVGPVTILKYGYQDTVEQQFLSHLYKSATRDGLTGVYNKRFFLDQLDQEIAYHRRHDEPLTLILLDLDFFKSVNDTYGHQYGDALLKQLAVLLNKGCRAEDILVRYGGEEFAVILRQTPSSEGRAIARRLREMVAAEVFSHRDIQLRVTISVGVVTRQGPTLTSSNAIIEDADKLLYKAKQSGRNRVCADPPG